MKIRYYIGEGPEAEALVAEVMEKRESVRAARHSICVEYGADGIILNHNGQVEGLYFKEKQTRPYLKGSFHSRGDSYYDYRPKLNSKAGKELAAKLADPMTVFNESDYLVGRLQILRTVRGFHAASRTGMAFYFSVAGTVNGKLLVKIPDTPDNPDHEHTTMPDVPAWLCEVKESEWLAAQGK